MTDVAVQVADKLSGIDLRDFTHSALVTSTRMIPKHTADALMLLEKDSYLHVRWGEYGWIFVTGVAPASEYGAHPELRALLDFAERHGCTYLQLDVDGQALPFECGFPTFVW